jgi:predicted transcriptional regulator
MIGELQKHIDKIINEQNNQGLPEFEGYSPFEMQYILYDTFGENSPIQLLKLTDSDYQNIPILNQVKYLLKLIDKQGEIKLTNKGFLPTKIVSDIYSQGFIKDEFIESGISKLYKETDSISINLTRILSELSGLAKKRNKKLSLTKKGKAIIENDYKMLFLILKTFGDKFNWAYYDGYGENNIGQLGFGFSLILLSKYGNKKRTDKFYSDKYFKAFPQLINESLNPSFGTLKEYAGSCYSVRIFERFLGFFGLTKIESEKIWGAEKYVVKTELFDKLIKLRHTTRAKNNAGRTEKWKLN